MPSSSILRYAGYALLIPSLLVASHALASCPLTPKHIPTPTDPGMSSLPLNSRSRIVYPEDFLEGGEYVQLPLGKVRYWLLGPPTGKKIVFIHGITIPSIAFAKIAPVLADAGFRVLLYDLYGRGYSDAPKGMSYDPQLYATQLALLLQHLNWRCTCVLGFSMGGAIAGAKFVAAFPALVEGDVILVASAGAGGPPPTALSKFPHWLFAEDRVKRRFAARVVASDAIETPMQEIVRLQAEELPGYPRAILSSFHDGIIGKLEWAFSSPSWREKRVLLINGDEDKIIPPAAAHILQEMLISVGAAHINKDISPGPDVTLVSIAGSGHDLTWTHSDEVCDSILGFFEGNRK
ncbi:hydrolase-4 domain-containing protein [Favolaschia claudopus]|uniref:Hydrolase-4 domain-containing protein n=1 Tax=Favolaschia claudopus TaxID=2862362 RepID=A0AAW0CS34_9AGAR